MGGEQGGRSIWNDREALLVPVCQDWQSERSRPTGMAHLQLKRGSRPPSWTSHSIESDQLETHGVGGNQRADTAPEIRRKGAGGLTERRYFAMPCSASFLIAA